MDFATAPSEGTLAVIMKKMSVERKYLEKLKSENTLVDIYTDNYEESFYGFIVKFNEDFLLLEHFNDDLIYNGIIIFKTEDITRIKWSGNDLNSSFALLDESKRMEIVNGIEIDSLNSIINSVSKIYGHINLSIQDIDSGMCIIGEVNEMDEEKIVINQFGTKATIDRTYLMISTKDITKVEAGGIYELNLMKLHNISKK